MQFSKLTLFAVATALGVQATQHHQNPFTVTTVITTICPVSGSTSGLRIQVPATSIMQSISTKMPSNNTATTQMTSTKPTMPVKNTTTTLYTTLCPSGVVCPAAKWP